MTQMGENRNVSDRSERPTISRLLPFVLKVLTTISNSGPVKTYAELP
jgi:hypothetical protein